MPFSSGRAEVERENDLDAVGGTQHGKAVQHCIREFRNGVRIVIETSGAYLKRYIEVNGSEIAFILIPNS